MEEQGKTALLLTTEFLISIVIPLRQTFATYSPRNQQQLTRTCDIPQSLELQHRSFQAKTAEEVQH